MMDTFESNIAEISVDRRDNLLNAIKDAAGVLLASDDDDEESFEASLLAGMELIGASVDVDRIYIMKNESLNGEQYFVYQYEWANAIGRLGTYISKGTKFPYAFDMEWSFRFSQGECLNGPLYCMSPGIRKFFSRIQVKSVLVMPIFIKGHFWGLSSFSDCRNYRTFSDEEVSILHSGALMMVSAANRSEQNQSIREAHEHSKLLMDAMPLACHLWDENFKVYSVNEEAVRLFKAPDKQFVINNHISFSPEFQPDGQRTEDKTRKLLKKALDEGKCVDEWLHNTFEGESIPVEITLIRIYKEGKHIIAAYARDLREQKRMMNEISENTAKLELAMKDAQAANNAKSDFLAGMSHEMRTPLSAVIGLSGLTLEMDGLDGDAKKNLEKIYNAGSTLLNIVNDILDISKIEAGKFELILNEYDTPSLINDTVTQNILRIGEKPIAFNLDISEDMPTRLYGDDLRIKQVLSNLLSNAFKYTDEGLVELGMRCDLKSKGAYDDSVCVTAWVKDTGRGIQLESIDKLFADYSQVDTGTNHKIEGTGLGLAITKKMLELMDGSITVESEYGKGSVFTVRFKQKFVTGAPIGACVVENLRNFQYSDNKRNAVSQIVRVKLPYARVLVVDDNVTNLDVARGVMMPYEMHIDCVSGGQQAVNAIRMEKVKYNAIFMDHMMPGMDGIEAVRLIRNLDSDYAKNIPIIALTANAITGNEKMFLSKGFQAFLSKPINIMQLDSIIKRWIRDKSKETFAADELNANAYDGRSSRTDAGAATEISIEGVDARRGLSMYAGMADVYLPILRSYAENTPAIIGKLRCASTEDLSDYIVHVHSLKGSSAAICAEEIRRRGAELEMMAKSGDLRGVIEKNEAFLIDVEILVGNIKAWMLNQHGKKERPCQSAPGSSIMAELRQCLINYDVNGVDDIMDTLERSDYDDIDSGLITWLEERIVESEFEEAAKRISDLLEKADMEAL